MEHNHKKVLFIGIAVLVVFGFILVLSKSLLQEPKTASNSDPATSQQQENEWKQYRSEVYKFSLEYPSAYLFDENIVGGPVLFSASFGPSYELVNGTKHPYHKAVMDFLVTVHSNDKGLESVIQQGNEQRTATEKRSELIGTEKVAGYPAQVIKSCDIGNNCEKIVYFTDQKRVYSVQMSRYFTRAQSSEKDVLDKMLISLKFE